MAVPSDIRELCRICGIDTGGLRYDIYDHEGFSSKIMECLPIIVEQSDALPKCVCGSCFDKVLTYTEFRHISIQTEKSFLFRSVQAEVQQMITEQGINIIIASEQLPENPSQITPLECFNYVDPPVTNLVVLGPVVQGTTRPVRTVRLKKATDIDSDLLTNRESVKEISDSSGVKNTVCCSFCKETFSVEVFQAHKSMEHYITCDRCDLKFAFDSDFTAHASNCQLKPNYEPVRPKSSWRGKSFECDICLKVYRKKSLLQMHLRRHTGECPFECPSCDKKFSCKSVLKTHLRRHNKKWRHICDYCGKGFVDKSGYVYHVRSNHTNERPFQCTYCDKCFLKNQDLTKHIQSKHLVGGIRFTAKALKCEQCDRVCKDPESLRSHRKSHIPVGYRRKHKCSLCEAAFVTKLGLENHMNRHNGAKPFKCEECEKQFFSKKGLQVHTAIHSGVKSFVCEFCGRAFSQDNTLKVHRRTHTGERPYECDICQRRFTQSSSLKSHRKLHT